jgi:hypothetical protein
MSSSFAALAPDWSDIDIFPEFTVVRLQNENLTDLDDADAPIFHRAYRTVLLTKLDRGTTTLQGAYADNLSAGAVTSRHRVFFYNRSRLMHEHGDAARAWTEGLSG